MQKFLCATFLLLSGVAQAAPFTSSADNFSANFPGSVSTRVDGDMRAYAVGGEGVKGVFGVAVFTGKSKHTRYDMLKLIKDKDPGSHLVAKEIQVGPSAVPGLEISGLDEHGIPTLGRIVTTKERTYLVISNNYDMAASQKFVSSFRLLEAAPKKRAVTRKK